MPVQSDFTPSQIMKEPFSSRSQTPKKPFWHRMKGEKRKGIVHRYDLVFIASHHDPRTLRRFIGIDTGGGWRRHGLSPSQSKTKISRRLSRSGRRHYGRRFILFSPQPSFSPCKGFGLHADLAHYRRLSLRRTLSHFGRSLIAH